MMGQIKVSHRESESSRVKEEAKTLHTSLLFDNHEISESLLASEGSWNILETFVSEITILKEGP